MLENCRQFVQNRENNVIRQAKNFVTQHYAESISLAQVAKHVCLSTSYFSTLFKTETGVGFVEYLQHIRIEQAKKLLKTSKMRIADIAEKVGYRDIKFFNKIFVRKLRLLRLSTVNSIRKAGSTMKYWKEIRNQRSVWAICGRLCAVAGCHDRNAVHARQTWHYTNMRYHDSSAGDDHQLYSGTAV